MYVTVTQIKSLTMHFKFYVKLRKGCIFVYR